MDVGRIHNFQDPEKRKVKYRIFNDATKLQRKMIAKKDLRRRLGIQENMNKIDEQAQKEFDNGEYRKWVEDLIEHDANPLNPRTDKEFAEEKGLHINSIFKARRTYPNYAMAVAYRRKKYLTDLGNFSMKVLVQRAPLSDLALRMALEISGVYTPTMKQQIETLDPEIKRQRVIELMQKYSGDEKEKQDESTK